MATCSLENKNKDNCNTALLTDNPGSGKALRIRTFHFTGSQRLIFNSLQYQKKKNSVVSQSTNQNDFGCK